MEKTIIIKLKKASFYKAFGRVMNLVRPVMEVTEEEFAKLSDDIKLGVIEVVKTESEAKITEEKKEKMPTEVVVEVAAEVVEDKIEESSTEEITEEKKEENKKGRGRKASE